MHQSCALCNLRTPCKDLMSMRYTDMEVNPNLEPVVRFSLNGWRDSESWSYIKRLPRGQPGSAMVVQMEATSVASRTGGWVVVVSWRLHIATFCRDKEWTGMNMWEERWGTPTTPDQWYVFNGFFGYQVIADKPLGNADVLILHESVAEYYIFGTLTCNLQAISSPNVPTSSLSKTDEVFTA